MSITEKPPGLLTPDQLRQMSQEAEMAKAREAIAKAEKAEKEQAELHEAFMKWEIGNDALERVMKLVQRSALDGEHKVFLFKFPASYCTDHGRAINNFEPSWPETLVGGGKRAYEEYEKHLKPLGYKMTAEILDYPGGSLGDVSVFLSW